MAEAGIGRVIDNKYEIIAAIGKGGMSNVWLGRDRRLDKLWAIKEIKPSAKGRQAQANRQAIIDEANFMKRLDHPAIPRVVDIIDTGASIFVVMDYVNGTALSKVLRQQGEPFTQEEVIDWGIQLCDVLGYLHTIHPPAGYPVVYRDLKPSNVMLRDDGSVKLIDFGISMELLPNGPSDDRVIGTVGYGAPEQVDPQVHKTTPVDTRADVYALGTTLYTLVTGHVPKMRTDESGRQVVDFNMKPIRDWNPQLSDGLQTIIERATQRNPLDRYQTIAEMRYDLEHYEELTAEYRAVQQAKVNGFWARVRVAVASAALGVACLVGSSFLRSSNYDNLLYEASLADTEEQNVQVTAGADGKGAVRNADASPAEEALTQAIELAPDQIEPYQQLLSVYQADTVFTPTESRRWLDVWKKHGRSLSGNPQYGRLCFDAGILYLSYYDYLGLKDVAEQEGAAVTVATGQGAVQNASRSVEWFRRAKRAASADSTNHAGLRVDENIDELVALEAYETIGQFYDDFTTASFEGRDVSAASSSFWESITQAILGADDAEPIALQSSEIVQLRLYQVAFESLNSPTYLTGFRRAGVTADQAINLLETIRDRLSTEEFSSFVEANPNATKAMYDEITGGYEDALANINRTYNGPTSRVHETGKDGD